MKDEDGVEPESGEGRCGSGLSKVGAPCKLVFDLQVVHARV